MAMNEEARVAGKMSKRAETKGSTERKRKHFVIENIFRKVELD